MREHPILFSGPMVRALLAGTKTQTRRIVRGAEWADRADVGMHSPAPEERAPLLFGALFRSTETGADWLVRCPYGMPGDRLWVRETWRAWVPDSEWNVRYAADSALRESVASWDEGPNYLTPEDAGVAVEQARWRPSIFMPRWASRITLEIADVRVQRLQEISEADAMDEGIEIETLPRDPDNFHPPGSYGFIVPGTRGSGTIYREPQRAFAVGWDTINGKRAPWASNPWVWALTFRRFA